MNYILNYEKLQLGDIILESGYKLHSKAIKTYTKSNFSHVMIYIGGMSIIHAEKEGIFSLNPQRLLVKNIEDLKVLRPKKDFSTDEKDKLVIFLRSQIGSLYSVKDALSVVKNNKENKSDSKYQFCSRLVAQAYDTIGYKIVNSIDFCSPADIENSNFFDEVKDVVQKAKEQDIKLALTRNGIKENQQSMYEWLNKTRDIAYKEHSFNIHKINDVDIFLQRFSSKDEIVCKYIVESGYLEKYLIEIENNQHMHNENMFLSKYENIDNIIHALVGEFNIIHSPTNRHIQNLHNSILNYETTKLQFYNLHINLYKTLLGVSLSKFITLLNVSNKLILAKNNNKELGLVMFQSQKNIKILQQLGIEKYSKILDDE